MNSCPPVDTKQYGTFRMWDLIIFALNNKEDRDKCYAAKHNLGDTHCIVPYARDAGKIYYGAYPYNQADDPQFEQHPNEFIAALTEVILNGFTPIIALQSDGEGNRETAFSQLHTLIPLLQGGPVDLTKYCLVFLGWDSVFYGWTDPNEISRFGQVFRQLCPDGYLAIEHDSGHIPLGEGGQDFQPGGRMTYFDTIMSEYDYSNDMPPNNTIWQINGRLVKGYIRPPDQPSDDDPHPPYYMAVDSPRGPFFHCAWEWEGTYFAIRDRSTVKDEAERRDYMHAQGCRYTG